MKDQIEKLLRIQGLDLRIHDLESMLTSLPDELETARKAVEARRSEFEAIGAETESLLLEQRKKEGVIEKNVVDIGRFGAQQNSVKTNEAYQALEKEKDTLLARNSTLEEEILVALERLDELEREKKRGREAIRQAEENHAAEEKRIEGELASVRVDIEQAKREREEVAAGVDKRYLSRYETIRGSQNRQVLARIEREACELCNRQVPPQRVIEVRKMTDLINCEGCGRILVWEE